MYLETRDPQTAQQRLQVRRSQSFLVGYFGGFNLGHIRCMCVYFSACSLIVGRRSSFIIMSVVWAAIDRPSGQADQLHVLQG